MSLLSSLSPQAQAGTAVFSRIQDKIGLWFKLLIASSIIIVSGCTNFQSNQGDTSVDWANHQLKLEQLNTYKVTGKIGYKDPNNRQSASFILKHADQYSELKLLTFLGQTVLTLQMTPTGSMVTDADGGVRTASQANDLLKELTGLTIPVSELPDWIKGLPTDAENITFNETHTVSSLQKEIDNRNWTLSYLSYQSYSPKEVSSPEEDLSLPLPKEMFLKQDDTEIKILINNWVY